MGASFAGRLLVASPALEDGIFDRTVVLILEHDPREGAMGLVLNEPSDTAVSEAMPEWAELAAEPADVFVGGPVDHTVVFGLGSTRASGAEGWQQVLGRLGVVDLARDPVLVGIELEAVRLYVGYAGWSPGQLEGEIEMGAWLVVDAEPGDVLTDDPARLWRAVLRRQPGELALLSTYPVDPTQN